MDQNDETIPVEIAYVTTKQQVVLALSVPLGATIQDAIEKSGILQQFPLINLSKQAVGVFSKIKDLTDTVTAGDRIEIYRPLFHDPKAMRRMRADALKATRKG